MKKKAKRYDEAIIRGSRLWESDMITRENYEYIFPEVKESEDERIRKEIIDYLSTADDKELIPYESWIAWLEKQGAQPKQEWNEEDEQTFIKSVEALEDSYNFMFADWLKEHKNQLLRPQNTWKPSDEQIQALEDAIYHVEDDVATQIAKLIGDLKKLKYEK